MRQSMLTAGHKPRTSIDRLERNEAMATRTMKSVMISSKLNTWERLNILSALEDRLATWQNDPSIPANSISRKQLADLIIKLESNDIYTD